MLDETDLYEEIIEGMSPAEERANLERDGRIAAHIERDLQLRGPLYLYIEQRRREAGQALRGLAEVDPRDGVAIAELQAVVREFSRACGWVFHRLEASDLAAEVIRDRWGNEDHGDDGGDQ